MEIFLEMAIDQNPVKKGQKHPSTSWLWYLWMGRFFSYQNHTVAAPLIPSSGLRKIMVVLRIFRNAKSGDLERLGSGDFNTNRSGLIQSEASHVIYTLLTVWLLKMPSIISSPPRSLFNLKINLKKLVTLSHADTKHCKVINVCIFV